MWEALAGLLEEYDLVQSLVFVWSAHSEDGSRPDNLIAMIAEAWIPRVRAPEPFADVVRGAVSPREEMIIAVGQKNNRLHQTLRDLYITEFRRQNVIAHWKGSLFQPASLVFISWATMVAIAVMNANQPAGFLSRPHKWGRLLMSMSSSFLHWWSWIVPLLVIIVTLFLKWSLNNWLNESRRRLDHYYPWALVKWAAGADFMNCLLTLTSAGLDSSGALLALGRTAEPYLKWQVAAVEPFTRNKSIGFSLRQTKRHFPDAGLIAILDHAGQLPTEKFRVVLKAETDKYSAEVLKRFEKARAQVYLWALVIFGVLQILSFLFSGAGALS
jgi:hypothetical protein